MNIINNISSIFNLTIFDFYEKIKKTTANFYKFINEIPTVFIIIIILLVVLKLNLG